MIVDAQVHIWAADTPERPWVPGEGARTQKPYLVTTDLVLEGMRGGRRRSRRHRWTPLPGPWRQAVTLFTEGLPWLSAEDREWIIGQIATVLSQYTAAVA